MKYELIVKKYYEGLEEGKLLGRKCTRCGSIEFPPVIACNECGCPQTEWTEVSGKAVMTHFTIPGTFTKYMDIVKECGPYVNASIKLEEGAEFNAVVLGVPRKQKECEKLYEKLPLPVQAKIVQKDEFKTLYFELIEQAD